MFRKTRAYVFAAASLAIILSMTLSSWGQNVSSQTQVPSRITFDVNPGKIQLRMSVTGAASQVLDSETREIAIPDLTSTQTMIGTPEILRARTAREFQQRSTRTPIAPCWRCSNKRCSGSPTSRPSVASTRR